MAFFGLFGGKEEIDSLKDLEQEFLSKGCATGAIQIAEYRARLEAGEDVGCKSHNFSNEDEVEEPEVKKGWFW